MVERSQRTGRSTPLSVGKAAAGRRGMTLVEILIATAVLALGMLGIVSVLPVGLHNSAVAVNRSRASSVARSAILSLRHYAVDLSVLPEVRGEVAHPTGGPPDPLAVLYGHGDITDSIRLYNADIDPHDAAYANFIRKGNGFRVPGAVSNPEEFWNLVDETGAADSTGAVMNLPYLVEEGGQWQPTEFSWSAIMVPGEPLDQNPDPPYRLQVAVWHEFKLRVDSTVAPYERMDAAFYSEGAGTPDAPHVKFWGGDKTFANAVQKGHYIRAYDPDRYASLWFRIKEVRPASETENTYDLALLANDPGFDISDPDRTEFQIASPLHLSALYDSVVFPE